MLQHLTFSKVSYIKLLMVGLSEDHFQTTQALEVITNDLNFKQISLVPLTLGDLEHY